MENDECKHAIFIDRGIDPALIDEKRTDWQTCDITFLKPTEVKSGPVDGVRLPQFDHSPKDTNPHVSSYKTPKEELVGAIARITRENRPYCTTCPSTEVPDATKWG